MKNVHFTTFLNARHARSDERVATSSRRICILPQVWASDTHQVTQRIVRRASKFAFYHIPGHPTRTKWRKGRSANLKICSCTILSFRHARSDERVARRASKLPCTTVLSFRHARSDVRVAPICEKFAFYHSFERPTRTNWRESCQIHRCDPCAPTEKEYILRLFQRILISSLSLQSFL